MKSLSRMLIGVAPLEVNDIHGDARSASCDIFLDQLRREIGEDNPESGCFAVLESPEDGGCNVYALYDEANGMAVEWAFSAVENTPYHWDEIALQAVSQNVLLRDARCAKSRLTLR